LFSLLVIFIIIPLILAFWLVNRYQSQQVYIEPFTHPKTSFPLTLKWQMDLGHSAYDTPAYLEGLVLMPADSLLSSSWYGLEAKTGQIVWQTQTGKHNILRCLSSEYLVLSSQLSFISLECSTTTIITH
jgi:hypothetical protein